MQWHVPVFVSVTFVSFLFLKLLSFSCCCLLCQRFQQQQLDWLLASLNFHIHLRTCITNQLISILSGPARLQNNHWHFLSYNFCDHREVFANLQNIIQMTSRVMENKSLVIELRSDLQQSMRTAYWIEFSHICKWLIESRRISQISHRIEFWARPVIELSAEMFGCDPTIPRVHLRNCPSDKFQLTLVMATDCHIMGF